MAPSTSEAPVSEPSSHHHNQYKMSLWAAGACAIGVASIAFWYWRRNTSVNQKTNSKNSSASQQQQAANKRQFILEKRTLLTKGVPNPVMEILFRVKDGIPLNIEPGQHIYLHFHKSAEDGVLKSQKRPYSPVARVEDSCNVDFIIKAYPNGQGSQHLMNMNLGDEIEFTGPTKNLFRLLDIDLTKTRIMFIAGGSGLTPFCGMMKQLEDEEKELQREGRPVKKPLLVFANRTWKDVFFTKQLYRWYQKGTIDVIHALSQEKQIEGEKERKHHPDCWKEVVEGRIHMKNMKQWIEEYGDDGETPIKFLLCGPPAFCGCVRKMLKEMGIEKKDMKIF